MSPQGWSSRRSAVARASGNILAGEFSTLGQLAETLAQVTGKRAPRARIPYPIAWLFAAASQTWARLTHGETLVTLEAVRSMQARLQVTSAKAQRELGWRYRPLHETLHDTATWYQAHGMAA